MACDAIACDNTTSIHACSWNSYTVMPCVQCGLDPQSMESRDLGGPLVLWRVAAVRRDVMFRELTSGERIAGITSAGRLKGKALQPFSDRSAFVAWAMLES